MVVDSKLGGDEAKAATTLSSFTRTELCVQFLAVRQDTTERYYHQRLQMLVAPIEWFIEESARTKFYEWVEAKIEGRSPII